MKKLDGFVLSVAGLFVFIRDIAIVVGKRDSKIIIDKFLPANVNMMDKITVMMI